jgi:hypothetical protein
LASLTATPVRADLAVRISNAPCLNGLLDAEVIHAATFDVKALGRAGVTGVLTACIEQPTVLLCGTGYPAPVRLPVADGLVLVADALDTLTRAPHALIVHGTEQAVIASSSGEGLVHAPPVDALTGPAWGQLAVVIVSTDRWWPHVSRPSVPGRVCHSEILGGVCQSGIPRGADIRWLPGGVLHPRVHPSVSGARVAGSWGRQVFEVDTAQHEQESRHPNAHQRLREPDAAAAQRPA